MRHIKYCLLDCFRNHATASIDLLFLLKCFLMPYFLQDNEARTYNHPTYTVKDEIYRLEKATVSGKG